MYHKFTHFLVCMRARVHALSVPPPPPPKRLELPVTLNGPLPVIAPYVYIFPLYRAHLLSLSKRVMVWNVYSMCICT